MPKQVFLSGKYGSIIGNYAIVDDEDFEKIRKLKWHAINDGKTFYAGNWKHLLLHRFITNCPKNLIIDHLNHNGLDNRKENLKICTYNENNKNSSFRKTNTSGFTGVTWDKESKKWRAQIRFNKKSFNLGRFSSRGEAYLTYKNKLKEFSINA